MYEDNWPIDDILKVRMKNITGRKPRCGRLGRNINVICGKNKVNQETNDEMDESESEEDECMDELKQILAWLSHRSIVSR